MDFEEKLKKLEMISERMRDENQALDSAIASFEEGMSLTEELEKELNTYEKKVKILLEKNGESYFEDFK